MSDETKVEVEKAPVPKTLAQVVELVFDKASKDVHKGILVRLDEHGVRSVSALANCPAHTLQMAIRAAFRDRATHLAANWGGRGTADEKKLLQQAIEVNGVSTPLHIARGFDTLEEIHPIELTNLLIEACGNKDIYDLFAASQE